MSYDGNHTCNKPSNEPRRLTSRLADYGIYVQSKCDSSTKRASHRSSTTRQPSGMTHSEIRRISGTYAPYNGQRSFVSYLHFEQ